MIKKLLLLLLTIGMIAKRPGGGDRPGDGGETPEERRQREEDEMWGSHGRGNSATLEEQFDSIGRELGTAESSVDASPTGSSEPQGAWNTDDEKTRSDFDKMDNLGGLTWERRNKVLHGNPEDETDGGHLYGTNRPGKTEFPESWDEDTAAANVQDAARNPDSVNPRRGGDGGYEAHKQIDGVDVTVILNVDGSIYSAFPTGGTGTRKNPY